MEASRDIPYRTYWLAWLALLGLTVLMVFVGGKPLLVGGVALKATIIGLWFMHLRYESLGLGLAVVVAIFATGLVLFGLLIPDARVG